MADINAFSAILCAAGGYLIGNLQTALFISKGVYHEDIREKGSGNAGATNMVRVFGWKPGVVTFAADFLKGFLAFLLGRWLFGPLGGAIAGGFTVIGHCWPAVCRFRGGKGAATAFGLIWAAFPWAGLAALVLAVLIYLRWKLVSACSVAGALLFPILTLIFRRDELPLVVLSLIVSAVILFRHRDNIKRLLKGEEKAVYY